MKKSSSKPKFFVISANDLNTGQVVYLTEAGNWDADFCCAVTIEGLTESEVISQYHDSIDTDSVIDVIAEGVNGTNLAAGLNKMRARMRLSGPSVSYAPQVSQYTRPASRAA